MVKLSTIQPEDIRELEVPFGDDVLHVEVDMNAFTIGWGTRFQEAANKGDIGGTADEFFSLVKKWDLEDDDDEVYPLDESTVHRLSMRTFTKISGMIIEQIDPNELAPKKSRKR